VPRRRQKLWIVQWARNLKPDHVHTLQAAVGVGEDGGAAAEGLLGRGDGADFDLDAEAGTAGLPFRLSLPLARPTMCACTCWAAGVMPLKRNFVRVVLCNSLRVWQVCPTCACAA